ncbi:RagB/SusD family nutrient uptake outer membrane protein [Flavobacterium silvaticum]|uniref:RagB/SusD family nutrient uptake outer membrane protein n=1 Tax=Flavobacterium silvaticum TaxID=1852020 RepID=A0A972FMW7_9FLAO|nr:RagB/SusD family nutrient uptake outer membrane protein [Flavobacterium silvaticum]NMH28622.1 RagB/SusD family nutrient uptake outer membrane protein [Flavobacterium silvaticum]
MKNSNLKWRILIPMLALAFTGCVTDDDLVQLDPNNQTEATFWQNGDDAMRGINAVYSALLTDGTYMRCTPLLLDLKADDTRSNSPWAAMANTGRFNTPISDPAIYGWAFDCYYIGIFRANQVIAHVPDIEMDEALKNRILGQAYFMRGLYLFHAVNMFNSVPVPTDLTETRHPQRTPEEGWAQVIADFQMAADLLPASYVGTGGPDEGQKGRANKYAAIAYMGKAYLFNHDYTNAKAAFQQVIDSGNYALVANYRDNFTTNNELNSESIFEIEFSREAGGVALGWGGIPAADWGKTSARAITYAPRGFGWTDVQPTVTLFNEFHDELTVDGQVDPRLNATIFYNAPGITLYGQDFATRYASNPTDLNDLFTAKYQNSDGQFADEFDWRSGINERLMRYADVLMMYAECLNELGDTQGAYPYIQLVRSRVNLPDLATAHPNMTQAQMREQIGHERFLEFALEGHRFDDIRRWGWLNDPVKVAWLKTRDAEYNTFQNGREYFPIPQSEVDNNPGTQQNPTY